MADSVGIRLGVDGEKAFKASLAAVNSQLKSLGAEMLAVTASFTKNADSQEALAATNTVLGKSIDMQKTSSTSRSRRRRESWTPLAPLWTRRRRNTVKIPIRR